MSETQLTSTLQQMRGVIGREPDGDDKYVFQFDDVSVRGVHMIGVRKPLKVSFLVGEEPTLSITLQPWTGYARARCDKIVEQAGGDE